MIHHGRWQRHWGWGFISLLIVISSAYSEVTVKDDSANSITLVTPAKRVVSLAPHITELLFAAGAGHTVVGVSSWSDYPPEAKKLPVVAEGNRLDLERIIDLKPDLVIAWKSGSNTHQIKRLKSLGLTIFESEPRHFADIASSVERFAKLTGSGDGTVAAKAFREQLEQLKHRYSGKKTLRIFYQIWPSPLMTLNDQHLVADIFTLCGATNIFGQLPSLSPSISTEAVVKANPDAIIIVDASSATLDRWRSLRMLKATQKNNLFTVSGTLTNRAGPRIVEGAAQLCEHIDVARTYLQEQ